MLDSIKDLLSRQRLEVLVGMVMAEPIQKASAAQKNASRVFGSSPVPYADNPKRRPEAEHPGQPLHLQRGATRRACPSADTAPMRGGSVLNAPK